MKSFKRLWLLLLALSLTACQPIRAPAAESGSDAARIANAVSAAPTVIGQDATILGYAADSKPTVVLRQGTNGWTCYEDWPASPGNDPVCYDAVFDAWQTALTAGAQPGEIGTGIAYKLQGGSDPSNIDPRATTPAAGEAWISTPPHMMIVTPVGFGAGDYATEPQQDAPYIMWDETPYEHLIVPVVPTADDQMDGAEADLANTLRSAPASVALNATLMGPPAKEGDPMVVVKEGTNGWTCWPDNPASPGNDPSCSDAMMEAFWSIGDTQNVERAGLSYMLQGGSDPSNDDPSLSSPRAGGEWVNTPAHVMLVIPGGFDEKHFTTDHMSGYPYIMYSETGYEHIMIPVADMPAMGHDGSHNASIANAESAGIPAVASDSTVLDWAADGMSTVVLRQGANGWTCYADQPTSPANDPTCYDSVFNRWYEALLAGKEPQINGFGIAYKLKGGAIPSIADPSATKPVASEAWSSTSPYVMILSPNGFSGVKYHTKPNEDDPFIVWDGTPYEYLLAPLPPITAVQIPTLDDGPAQEVLLAEQALNYAADFAHDVFTADRMLTDDYSENGNTDKAAKLEWIKSGIYQAKQAEFTEVQVALDGDTATINFTIYFTGTYNGDAVRHIGSRVTNVWVKHAGQWQMVKSNGQ